VPSFIRCPSAFSFIARPLFPCFVSQYPLCVVMLGYQFAPEFEWTCSFFFFFFFPPLVIPNGAASSRPPCLFLLQGRRFPFIFCFFHFPLAFFWFFDLVTLNFPPFPSSRPPCLVHHSPFPFFLSLTWKYYKVFSFFLFPFFCLSSMYVQTPLHLLLFSASARLGPLHFFNCFPLYLLFLFSFFSSFEL